MQGSDIVKDSDFVPGIHVIANLDELQSALGASAIEEEIISDDARRLAVSFRCAGGVGVAVDGIPWEVYPWEVYFDTALLLTFSPDSRKVAARVSTNDSNGNRIYSIAVDGVVWGKHFSRIWWGPFFPLI